MFGEKARRIEELEQQVAELEEERESFAPFIADAQAIHAEVSNLMSQPGMTENIAQRAFETVLAARRGEIEDRLRDQHINDNVDDLLDIAADTVEQIDGERIAAEAAEMVQGDARLASAIAEKARQLVWQDALDRIAATEKKAAEEALLLEEERAKFFSKLNVQFDFDGELNLADEELLRYLKHGDRLIVSIKARQFDFTGNIEFTWRKESEKTKGWALSTTSHGKIFFASNEYNDGSTLTMPAQYITQPAIVTGNRFATGILRDDMQFGIHNGGDSRYWTRVGGASYHYNGLVTDCRLETKKIESLEPTKTPETKSSMEWMDFDELES